MSVIPKLTLTNIHCEAFLEDERFTSVRGTLQENGELSQWTAIVNDASARTINHILKNSIMDNVSFHQDRFEILIDTRGFRPEDIKCSLTSTLVEVIACKQEQIDLVIRNITLSRSYQLPQNVKPENGICCISSEGLLLITAPWLR